MLSTPFVEAAVDTRSVVTHGIGCWGLGTEGWFYHLTPDLASDTASAITRAWLELIELNGTLARASSYLLQSLAQEGCKD